MPESPVRRTELLLYKNALSRSINTLYAPQKWEQNYAGPFAMPFMRHARVERSMHAHARAGLTALRATCRAQQLLAAPSSTRMTRSELRVDSAFHGLDSRLTTFALITFVKCYEASEVVSAGDTRADTEGTQLFASDVCQQRPHTLL